MKILSFTGARWSKAAKQTCGWLLALSIVGGQLASGQTTMKFAGAQEAAPVETRQPVAMSSQVKPTTATTAQAAQNENEVYIFSFHPQKSTAGAPAAAVKQNVYQGSTLTAQFPPLPSTATPAATGDVYSILVRAGSERGTSTPPAPPKTPITPITPIPPYTPIASTSTQVSPATSTIAVATATQPARVAMDNSRPATAGFNSTPSDMFTALASAGREAKVAPVTNAAQQIAAPAAAPVAVVAMQPPAQPEQVFRPHDEDQFRSVLRKSTREIDETPVIPQVAEVVRPLEVPPVVPAPVEATTSSKPSTVASVPFELPPATPEMKQPEPTLAETNAPVEASKAARTPLAAVTQPQVMTPPAPAAPVMKQPVAPQSTAVGNEYTFITPRVNDLPELAPLQQPILQSLPATGVVMPHTATDRLAMMDTTPAVATPGQVDAANPGPTYVGSVTVKQGVGPLGQSCPYLPGQSGAPNICGVDCGVNGAPCNATWCDSHCIPWSLFGPGEYVGPARPEHVSTYYLRVNDLVTLTFIASRHKNAQAYRIGVGDRLKLEWLRSATGNEAPLDREIMVQPDGTIALPLIGEISAAGKTVKDLQDEIVKSYTRFQRDPQITVTPLEVNMVLEDILKAVTSQARSAGQALDLRVTPEGTIQAPGIGSVYVQGLTLEELRNELEARYAKTLGVALMVSPSLTERATSYVFMGGEVKAPGRYTLEGPTTVMQAIALAGGWNNGGNLRQVVIFRRDENWCLKATQINIRAPYYGNDPCPVDDVWLRDNDLVILPKSRILCATDVIELYFTRGIYAVFPITYVKDFSRGSSVVPVGP